MKNKLTKEQIKRLPEIVPTMTYKQIATEYGVSVSAINYWVKLFRDNGVKITKRRTGLINQIIDEESNI
jgi:transposase